MLQQLVPALRVLEARLAEVRHVVGRGEGDPEPGDGAPPRSCLGRFGRERVPATVALAECVHERPKVDKQALEEERVGVAQQDDVVSGLALGLGCALGRELETLDGVQLDRDAGLFAEGLGLAPQLIVGRGNEVTAAEEGELAALGECRSAIEGEGGPCPGRSTNELPARELSHGRTSSTGTAESPPFGQVAGRDRAGLGASSGGSGTGTEALRSHWSVVNMNAVSPRPQPRTRQPRWSRGHSVHLPARAPTAPARL